jgi:hypothetical protein
MNTVVRSNLSVIFQDLLYAKYSIVFSISVAKIPKTAGKSYAALSLLV